MIYILIREQMRSGNRQKIVLASSSPRRRRLLEQVGIPFEVFNPGEVESTFGLPKEIVVKNAKLKALMVAEKIEEGLVIGADTVVVIKGKIFEKPENILEAEEMLKTLSGTVHRVLTGIAIIDARSGRIESDLVETKVRMLPLSNEEIQAYMASGEPIGKAGGYAIQGLGALLIDTVQGCFYNVVGLPLSRLSELLKTYDFHFLRS